MKSIPFFSLTIVFVVLSLLVLDLSVFAQSVRPAPSGLSSHLPSKLTLAYRQILRHALDRATLISDPVLQVEMNCKCAEYQVQTGDKVGARATYLKTLPMALKHQDDIHCDRELTHMARWLVKERDTPHLMQLVAQIKRLGQQASLLSDVAITQANDGQFAAALATAEMLVPSEHLAHTCAQIAIAQARSGQKAAADKMFARSLNLTKDIVARDRKSIMRSEIVQARAQAAQFGEALALADTLRKSDLYALALRDIASAQAEAGRPEEALALVADLKDANASGWAKVAIVMCYITRNDIAAALRVADSIDDTDCHLFALQKMVDNLVRTKQFSRISTIIPQEQTLAQGVREIGERGLALLAIAEHQEVASQHAEAIATLEFVQPLLVNLAQEKQPAYLWARLASIQIRLGRMEEALKTLKMLKSITTRGFVIQYMAFARAQTEDVEAVLRWCDTLPTAYEQTEGLLGTVNGLLTVNKIK